MKVDLTEEERQNIEVIRDVRAGRVKWHQTGNVVIASAAWYEELRKSFRKEAYERIKAAFEEEKEGGL